MYKKNNLTIFFFLIVLGLFIVTEPAHAIFTISEDLWGWIESSLDALDFVDTTILNTYFKFLLYLAAGVVALALSSAVVDWVVHLPLTLHNDLVLSGWRFIAGLTNLFLILIFVAIALSYILRLETFAAKKALPRLIIVAILINFSLVFMGIFVDIAQLFLNGILNALGGGLFSNATFAISISLLVLLAIYAIGFAAYITVSLVPGANVAAAFTLALMGTTVLLPWFVLSIVFLITAIALSMIFFTLFMFFVFRIAVVWILAIFSPLAFASAILPQTQKYWQKWLNALIEWLSFGIIALLLAGLGLRLFGSGALLPFTADVFVPIRNLAVIVPAFIYNYLFLLVYLGVVYHVTKKYAPALAGVLTGYAMGLVGRATPVARGIGRDIKGGIEQRALDQKNREKLMKSKEKALGRPLTKDEKLEAAGLKGKRFAGMRMTLSGWGGRAATGITSVEQTLYRTTPELEQRKEIEKAKAAFERKGYTAEELGSPSFTRTLNRPRKAAALLRAAELEGGKGISKFKSDKDFEEATRHIYTVGTPDQTKTLKKFGRWRIEKNKDLDEWVNSTEVKEEDIKRARKDKIKVDGKSVDEALKTPEDTKKLYKEIARRNAMEALKAEDYDKILPETAETDVFKETLVKYGRSREGVRRLLEKGILDWKAIEDTIKKIGGEKGVREGVREVAKTNPIILTLPYTPGGTQVRATPLEGYATKSKMLKEIADVESKKAEGEITGEEKRAPPKEEFGKPKKIWERKGPTPPFE